MFQSPPPNRNCSMGMFNTSLHSRANSWKTTLLRSTMTPTPVFVSSKRASYNPSLVSVAACASCLFITNLASSQCAAGLARYRIHCSRRASDASSRLRSCSSAPRKPPISPVMARRSPGAAASLRKDVAPRRTTPIALPVTRGSSPSFVSPPANTMSLSVHSSWHPRMISSASSASHEPGKVNPTIKAMGSAPLARMSLQLAVTASLPQARRSVHPSLTATGLADLSILKASRSTDGGSCRMAASCPKPVKSPEDCLSFGINCCRNVFSPRS